MKKLSETVYRSPKWLQKYADFGFRTGEEEMNLGLNKNI
jgi:hypothetical protein